VLQGAHNVRDLGGYRLADGRTIAWRRLLRGDGLHGLTADDLVVLEPFGLATVIDLRRDDEIAERGTFPVERLPVDLVHLPVMDSTWMRLDVTDFSRHADPEVAFLTWAYEDMLAVGGPSLGEALRHLARPGALPAIFHCAAGKDRTGVLAALLLAALGADDDLVVADYALTAVGMARMRQWYATNQPEVAARMAEVPSMFFAARPEAMKRTLDHVRATHGSIRAYLATLGVDDVTLDTLADALTQELGVERTNIPPPIPHFSVGRRTIGGSGRNDRTRRWWAVPGQRRVGSALAAGGTG
jgi:protein-tyrosine phosphatase